MDLFGDVKNREELPVLNSGDYSAKKLLENKYLLPRKGLVIVVCKDNYYSFETTKNLAINWLGEDNLNGQLFTPNPEGVGWKIDEVEELIIKPSYKVALNANIILVTQADLMDDRSYDKLLKTIEEPESNSIYIMLIKAEKNLKKTILGRAGVIINLLEPGIDELKNYRTNVKIEIGDLYGNSNYNLLVFKSMLEDIQIYDKLVEVNSLLSISSTPAINSRKIIQGVESLSKSIGKTEAGDGLDHKQIAREILLDLLTRYQSNSSTLLRQSEDIGLFRRREKAAESFLVGSRFNTPMALLVYNLLAA